MEVARELLRYASPPRGVGVALSACIATEQQLPACILAAVREHAPQLAGPSGATLLAQRESRAKVLTYYRQLLWGDAGTLADHVLLWWSRPLGEYVQLRDPSITIDVTLPYRGGVVGSWCAALVEENQGRGWYRCRLGSSRLM